MFYLACCIISAFSKNLISPLSDFQIVYSNYTFNYYIFSGKLSPQEYSPTMKIFNYDKYYKILKNSFHHL